MPSLARVLALTFAVLLGAGAVAAAQGPAVPFADSLRSEWTVEPTRAGRAQVVGYLDNDNIKDAANVWLRVDQLGADGAVAGATGGAWWATCSRAGARCSRCPWPTRARATA